MTAMRRMFVVKFFFFFEKIKRFFLLESLIAWAIFFYFLQVNRVTPIGFDIVFLSHRMVSSSNPLSQCLTACQKWINCHDKSNSKLLNESSVTWIRKINSWFVVDLFFCHVFFYAPKHSVACNLLRVIEFPTKLWTQRKILIFILTPSTWTGQRLKLLRADYCQYRRIRNWYAIASKYSFCVFCFFFFAFAPSVNHLF